MTKLSSHVALAPQFQRAIRVDLDWGNESALRGYVCQGSSAQTLLAMAQHLSGGQQSAFTWTGPYGGGKSSLALLLGSLLGGSAKLRTLARGILGNDVVEKIAKPFRVPGLGKRAKAWHVVRVAGQREDAVRQIAAALRNADIPRIGKRLGEDPDATRVLRVLRDLAEQPEFSGLLLLMDELGKLLEHTSGFGGDIHFFQELAETASRSRGRMVVVGVLHQAFEQYASRLGREARDEWSKIQGRFVDIPFVAAVDEVIELTGRAISTSRKHPQSKAASSLVSEVVRQNRPSRTKDLADRLDRCWPLHPVTAALLGPISKRRFGQNERSTFAFLGSSEPLGFVEFLNNTDDAGGVTYTPDLYWDYLRANLEPAILTSPDGHRWAQAAEAVARCESRGDKLRLRLMKCIALIDLFRNGSGLVASRSIISTCVPDVSTAELDEALKALVEASVAVYRKHLDAYAVFEGSDFDIETAVKRLLGESLALDVTRLERIAPLQPILPKRHYQTSGALRWFESALCTTEGLGEAVAAFRPTNGAVGRFILVIPEEAGADRKIRTTCKAASMSRTDYPIVVGFPQNAAALRELGRELVALEAVRSSHPELAGDAVARKELQARLTQLSARLETELFQARDTAEWYAGGDAYKIKGANELHALASDICDQTFRLCPAIQNELVNRPTVSSNAQAAINALVAAMVANPDRFAFGIEGYPPERGLYESIFRATGLHAERQPGEFGFSRPSKRSPSAVFVSLWEAADKLLGQSSGIVRLTDLFAVWQAPPHGLTAGISGLIALGYLFSNRSQLAAYQDGIYQPDLQAVFAHEVIRDPSVIGLRRVVASNEQADYLSSLVAAIEPVLGIKCEPEPLAVGRALVKFVLALPAWTRRTAQFGESAAKLRATLLAASDPHKLVLVDIPNLAEGDSMPPAAFLASYLEELSAAYPKLLADVRARFFRSLGARDTSPSALRSRAETVRGLTGDLRVEALAVQLSQYNGSDAHFESIVSLATQKPARDWTDLDVSGASLGLAELALKFRSAEVLAAVKNREPSRLAMGLVVGTGEHGRAAMRAIDVGADEMAPVQVIASQLLKLIENGGSDPRLALAALVQAGAQLIERIPEEAES